MKACDADIGAVLGGGPETPAGDTESAADLAEWPNLSPARTHALARKGIIPRTDGRFDLREAVRAYVEHLRAGQRGGCRRTRT